MKPFKVTLRDKSIPITPEVQRFLDEIELSMLDEIVKVYGSYENFKTAVLDNIADIERMGGSSDH